MLTAPTSLLKACRRLNPAVALDVDVVAVQSAALCSSHDDWTAGTLTTTAVDDKGAVRLAESGSAAVFSSGGTSGGATDHYHWFNGANNNGGETTWLDFWPDPTKIGPNGFLLHSLDLVLGRKDSGVVFGNPAPGSGPAKAGSKYVITVARLDGNWNREVLGDPVYLDCAAVAMAGGLVTINFRTAGRLITIRTGRLRTRTGSGFDGTAERAVDFVFEGENKVSHLGVPLGFSIGVSVAGIAPGGAWLGMIPTATLAAFNTSTFWRHSGGSNARDCGPYSPDAKGAPPLDSTQNPGYGTLSTGAVPGYGAYDTATLTGGNPNGQWGLSREVGRVGKPQTGAGQEPHGWQRPYHVVRAVTYNTSGTAKVVLDLGRVPLNEVHFRADAAEPTGTSVTYSLEGCNDGVSYGLIGAVKDGDVFTVASGNALRFYRVTATLNGTADGLVSPALQAVGVTERIRFATYPYMADTDSTATIDPTTAQTEIGELKLPLLKAGRGDYRDIVTSIASDYSAQFVEAWVYVRETVTGARHFLNLYRLETRDPDVAEETLTFVAGLDRLKVTVPPNVVTYIYPTDGSEGVLTGVSYNSGTHVLTLTVASTPFAAVDVSHMRYEGITGALAGTNWYITSTPSSSTFTITLEDAGQVPAIGDHFRIHSDVTTRSEVTYAIDFAAIYADILANQAAVPQRYRGALPATTGRTGTGRLESTGQAAIDALQNVALHCGGSFAWVRGRITYGDVYGSKDVVDTWSERDYVDLKTPTGYDRRMPSVGIKYGYDFANGNFNNEATFDDLDAIIALGRANLFDVTELPDELCKWNTDVNEAQFLAGMLLGAWSTGVRLWTVSLATPRPWLDYFDAVAISTDQYTDRRPAFAPDGVTDIGTPIRGRVSAVGVIVGKNLLGTEFTVAVRGLSQITAAAPTSGTVSPPPTPFALPTLDLSPTVSSTQFSIAFTSTGTVQYKIDTGAYGAATSPVVVARNAPGGADKTVTFSATLNGQTVYNTVTVPAQATPNNVFTFVGQSVTYNPGATDVVQFGWTWAGDSSAVFDIYIEESVTSVPTNYVLNGASPLSTGTVFFNYTPLSDIDPTGTAGRHANIGFYVVARFGGTTVTSDRLEVPYNRN